jgi:hypothetical protein
MSVREAKNGAAIAGAVLFIVPVIEVLFGARSIGAEHLVTGVLGLWLLGIAAAGRF